MLILHVHFYVKIHHFMYVYVKHLKKCFHFFNFYFSFLCGFLCNNKGCNNYNFENSFEFTLESSLWTWWTPLLISVWCSTETRELDSPTQAGSWGPEADDVDLHLRGLFWQDAAVNVLLLQLWGQIVLGQKWRPQTALTQHAGIWSPDGMEMKTK